MVTHDGNCTQPSLGGISKDFLEELKPHMSLESHERIKEVESVKSPGAQSKLGDASSLVLLELKDTRT